MTHGEEIDGVTATRPDFRPKAYSYLRFSSPEQAKGASRRRQIEAAAAWAIQRGMVLDEELRDEGISAFRGMNRAPTSALGGFLTRVQGGEVEPGSFLLVESFDRLSREEVLDALELFLGLTRAGITVVTLSDGQIYNRASLRKDQTQLIISIVIMSRAYEESATKSRRVGDAWRRKRVAARESRQAMTATCPGWIRLIGGPRTGHYELVPERAAIIRQMFEDVIAGDGRRTITKRLNAAGVEPWGQGGNKGMFWHDSYVQKILGSPACFGRYDKDDDRIDNYFPAVVSEDVYWRAKAAAASRMVGNGRTTRQFKNLLHGLARCPDCDGVMAYIDKGRRSKPALRCAAAHSAARCANRAAVRYSPMERLIVSFYLHIADVATFALGETTRRAAEEVGVLEKQRLDVEMREGRLVVAIEEGRHTSAIRKRLDDLALEKTRIDTLLSSLKATLSEEVEMYEDIEIRRVAVEEMIYDGTAEEIYRGRSTINARMRKYLEKVVVRLGEEMNVVFKPGFERCADQMLNIYGVSKVESR